MNTTFNEEGQLSNSLRPVWSFPVIRRLPTEESRAPSPVSLLDNSHACEERVLGNPVPDPALQALTTKNQVTVCIWKLNLHLVPDVYLLLKRTCSEAVFGAIIQIRRICQRDHRVRFEIDVPAAFANSFTKETQGASHRFAWKVRVQVKVARIHLAKSRLGPKMDFSPLRLCSLNINGLRGKRTDLEDYLSTTDIDIIGIQETRRKADHWRFHMLGYNVVEVTSTAGPGQRGLAIAVKEGLSSFPVGPKSQYFIFLRVFGMHVVKPFIVGTIYLPHRHANKNANEDVPGQEPPHVQARLDLIVAINRIRTSYPLDAITLMGDFNRNVKEMQSLVRQLPGFYLPVLTDSDTTVSTKNGRFIDHFLVTAQDKDLLQDFSVDESLDLSDHWPILANLHYRTVIKNTEVREGKCRWKVPRKSDTGAIADLYSNNRFNAFLEESDEEIDGNIEEVGVVQGLALGIVGNAVNGAAEDANVRLSTKVANFIQTCKLVGQDLLWVKQPTKKRRRLHPTTKQHQRACRDRRILYCEFRHLKRLSKNGGHLAPSPEEIAAAFFAYHEFRKNTCALSKRARSERWAKVVVQADIDRTTNPREFWSWLTTTSSWKRRDSTSTLQPMRDSQGVLQTEGGAIRRVWQQHYEDLASDVTGHSQDPAFWAEQLKHPEPMMPTLHDLNADILEAEVVLTLSVLQKNKAPGIDLIPVEFFMLFVPPAVVQQGDIIQEDENNRRPLRALTGILQDIWSNSFVPDSLNVAALVSIFKKDDPTQAGNYRGISLIDSLVKVLITLLTNRMQRRLEMNMVFTKGQGGFRSHEESVSQALALHEIVKRRQNIGKDTYALFLDYQKAFDTVPHEGLFRKMDIMGIRGRMLGFVQALYANSRVVVQANDGSHSEPFHLRRGVRQGCPMSPLLFIIYINDMFDTCKYGAKVPTVHCMRKGTTKFMAHSITGLLFADDAVALASELAALELTLREIIVWSDKHELSFGTGKCGLMHFTTNYPALEQDTIFHDKAVWQIKGVAIPVVDSYTYLGLDFFRDTSLEKMSASRTEKGRKALFHFKPFLSSPTIPIFAKLRILYAIIKPTMLYGSELWGLKNARGIQQEYLINRALRWILDFKGPIQLLSVGAMHEELQMTPFMAQMATRRVRGYLKFPTLKTWVAELMKSPLRLLSKNWQTTTEQWLNRYLKANVGASRRRAADDEPPFGTNQVETLDRTREVATKQCMTRWGIHAPHLAPYYDAKYLSLLDLKRWIPFFGKGLLLIMLVRCNGYWVQKRIDDCKPIHKRKDHCPYCHTTTSLETAVHLVFHCPKWAEFRQKYISGLIEACMGILTKHNLGTITSVGDLVGYCGDLALNLILGGRIGNDNESARLENWLGTGAVAIHHTDNEHDLACFDDVNGIWETKPCYRVAGFLASVDAVRSIAYRRALDGGDQEAWPPVLQYGQGPPG